MILYFAGAEGYHRELYAGGARNFLVTLAHDPEKIIHIRNTYPDVKIMIDSGAFTFWNSGQSMTPEQWLREFARFFPYGDEIIGLDVIFDGPGSLANYKALREQWPNIIPTYHVGEDMGILDEYASMTKRIAIGGLVNNTDANRETYVSKAFHKYRDTLQIHGFGVTTQKHMERFPFFSVDSTTWSNSKRYGETHYLRDGKKVMVRSPKVSRRLANKGLPVILDPDRQFIHNIHTFVEYEQHITRLWQARGIKW